MRLHFVWLFLFMFIAPLMLQAQTVTPREEFSVSIEDNSFFVEEAFNQEERVVQHIFNGLYYRRPLETTVAAFTQEWPLFGAQHQFSYTLAFNAQSGPDRKGFGDTFVNYRYQALDDAAWAAFSPRLSVIIPTGNVDKGFGYGVLGWQLNLPFSKRISEKFFLHWNAGATLYPAVEGTSASGQQVSHTLPWYNLAASAIWLAHPNVNAMLEGVANLTSNLDENGDLTHSQEFIISPGVRAALNFDGLQIVPGLAVPISFMDGDVRTGAFLYLSFEHPY